MAHQPSPSGGNPIQSDFQDFMQRGDDFFRIELLRPARDWYRKALDLNIDNEIVLKRIAECDRLLSFENRVVGILLVVAAILILGLVII